MYVCLIRYKNLPTLHKPCSAKLSTQAATVCLSYPFNQVHVVREYSSEGARQVGPSRLRITTQLIAARLLPDLTRVRLCVHIHLDARICKLLFISHDAYLYIVHTIYSHLFGQEIECCECTLKRQITPPPPHLQFYNHPQSTSKVGRCRISVARFPRIP